MSPSRPILSLHLIQHAGWSHSHRDIYSVSETGRVNIFSARNNCLNTQSSHCFTFDLLGNEVGPTPVHSFAVINNRPFTLSPLSISESNHYDFRETWLLWCPLSIDSGTSAQRSAPSASCTNRRRNRQEVVATSRCGQSLQLLHVRWKHLNRVIIVACRHVLLSVLEVTSLDPH